MSDHPMPERVEYGRRPFDADDLTPDPLELFGLWFAEAVASGLAEPNGVCLSTCDAQGGPDSRIVLLKGYDHDGFSFFSNFESSKGQQLSANPRASMVFWWQPLRRQVRLQGRVEKLPARDSDDYFASRPRESQLGAWASAQSREVESRQALEQRLVQCAERFPESAEVPRPKHWGGYRLVPHRLEFWQGRDSRLHDRFVYDRAESGAWTVRRLMP